MGEEVLATPVSSDVEPATDLRDPYEPNFLIGLPRDNESTTDIDGQSIDRPNPWVEPNRIDRRVLANLQKSSLQNDFHEAVLSLANPIDYTPTHPSKISKPSLFKRASARARTRPQPSAVSLPKYEPGTVQQPPNLVGSTNQGQGLSTQIPLQPPIFQPPIYNNWAFRSSYNARPNPPLLQGQPLSVDSVIRHQQFRPQFAGAPNFTRFGPQVDMFQPNRAMLNNSEPQPPPSQAHIGFSNPDPAPSVILPQMNTILPGQANVTPPVGNEFQTQAQAVRPAVIDFLRHVSSSGNVNYHALLQQIASGNSPLANTYLQQIRDFALNHAQHLQYRDPLQQHTQNLPRQPIPQAAQQPQPQQQQRKTNERPNVPTADEMVLQDMHVDANGDEEYNEVETYADYEPAKLQIGKKHPDPVVETSSLSTVEPPEIEYQLKLPASVIEGALLSSLQLESVIYACQQHGQLMPDRKTRRGFLIGDGAGVGKGRTIAGIIYENYLSGRKKSIWLSVSTDLKLDAERDLKDIGAEIPVFLLNKFQYGRRISEDNGVIFTTYSGLVSKSQSVRGNYGSRLAQLVAWAGPNFDGVIVFDECHKAKNISLATTKTSKKLSKTAEYVLEIQTKLPNARIVYASATGASETRHLGYMTRLGIWGPGTPYSCFASFCEAIERRGVGAMELVAVELKMRGSYIARQLSFKTTAFCIERANLTDDFVKLYDECVDMWSLAFRHFREAESYFSKKQLRSMWPSFWAAHQIFFKYMCISIKVPVVIDIAERSLQDGKCVVIGLQSTGEAKTLEALEEGDINDFLSTARATFESLVENHFPAPMKGQRRRPGSVSTDSDIQLPYTPSVPSDKSVSTTSNSTIIDDTWINSDACKFVVKDGIALPHVDVDSTTQGISKPKKGSKPVDKNQQALLALVKSKQDAPKSARTLRHKRRLAMRQTDKSRIKKPTNESSDTEISNPLSDLSEHLFSSTESTMSGASDSDYEADTVTEFDGSDDELVVVGTKSARKKNLIDDDSDDDIQITAIRTAIKPTVGHPVNTIVIESDDNDDDDELDDEEDGEAQDEQDPMIRFGARLTQMREELFAQIDILGPKLPNNTLDDLIDRLGGPSKVAEMTGRKGRIVKDSYGVISYNQRNEIDTSETLNIEEKKRFMDGEKLIAIISEAASSGISLQADKRVKNTRRRVHITIELPWSADRAVQQFGRTHRSNQVSGPEYVFIISDLAGETRFASIVAKRLESLGALTHGDRRATTEARDLSQFNLSGKYCRKALEHLNLLLETHSQFAEIKPNYKDGNFIRDAREAYINVGLGRRNYGDIFVPDPVALNINLFLNRILGMKVNIQNAIFDLFTRITDRLITRKKVSGEYDAGILELNSASGKTKVAEPEHFLIRTSSGIVRCTLRSVRYERGISWDEARQKLAEDNSDTRSGFYMNTNSMTKSKSVILAVREAVDQFRVYKPNVGRQSKLEMYSQIIGKYDKVNEAAAQRVWDFIYKATDTHCIHMCHFNNCKRQEARMKCDVGIRHRLFCIISGGILTVWPYLEAKVPEATQKIHIIRLRLDDNTRVIGPNITQDCLEKVRKALREGEATGIDFNPKKK